MGETNDEIARIVQRSAAFSDVFEADYLGPVAVETLKGEVWVEVAVFNEQSGAATRIDELIAEGADPSRVRMAPHKRHHHLGHHPQ